MSYPSRCRVCVSALKRATSRSCGSPIAHPFVSVFLVQITCRAVSRRVPHSVPCHIEPAKSCGPSRDAASRAAGARMLCSRHRSAAVKSATVASIGQSPSWLRSVRLRRVAVSADLTLRPVVLIAVKYSCLACLARASLDSSIQLTGSGMHCLSSRGQTDADGVGVSLEPLDLGQLRASDHRADAYRAPGRPTGRAHRDRRA